MSSGLTFENVYLHGPEFYQTFSEHPHHHTHALLRRRGRLLQLLLQLQRMIVREDAGGVHMQQLRNRDLVSSLVCPRHHNHVDIVLLSLRHPFSFSSSSFCLNFTKRRESNGNIACHAPNARTREGGGQRQLLHNLSVFGNGRGGGKQEGFSYQDLV